MIFETFLDKFAATLFQKYNSNFELVTIVLPNKRAKIFFFESLKKQTQTTFFAPNVISVEEFIEQVSQLRQLDSIQLLFEFYEVYLSIIPKDKQQTFEQFSNWAKTAIQDFNEIDRYLIEPDKVFQYLKEIEALKRWDLEQEDKTELIEQQLLFWTQLPLLYIAFKKHLLNKQVGYQGVLYKEAVSNIEEFSKNTNGMHYEFAGFNALNEAEVKIIKLLLRAKKASIYWDLDSNFYKDSYHDAGLFIRKIKNNWAYYKSNTFNWLTTDFQQEKNIEIIGTPKAIGQAKIVGSIIQKLLDSNRDLNKTAIVLADENLLIPLLYNLPNEIPSLNITMGFPSKNNPIQMLFSSLFKLHTNAFKRNENTYTLYYKEVLAILQNPYLKSSLQPDKLISHIRNNNFTFFSLQTLIDLKERFIEKDNWAFFDLLFIKWMEAEVVLERFFMILATIKNSLSNEVAEDKIAKAFVYTIYQLCVKIKTYQEQYNRITSIDLFFKVYQQLVSEAAVSFEGEPLNGLQIMGVLESRVLDFENVIITTVNEGKLPSGKTQNSFIPYDVKQELDMPTFKEKDAIYSYHFYHLLHRAKNIFLLYNTENEGMDSGEKSRYLTQLEYENLPNHHLTSKIYSPYLPKEAYAKTEIAKTPQLIEDIKKFALERGFSPSALLSYLRNPVQFYYQNILEIYDNVDVEEAIANTTLGTIIHETLELAYENHLDKYLTAADINLMIAAVPALVTTSFKKHYKEGETQKGKNYLSFEMAKHAVLGYLQSEKVAIENGEAIKVLFLEKKLTGTITIHGSEYKLKGSIDRIELRSKINEAPKYRIIDFKTGKVDAKQLKLEDFSQLIDLNNDKIIQLLFYAYLVSQNKLCNDHEIETGIISFKNKSAGFMPFAFGDKTDFTTSISKEIIENYILNLTPLLEDILNIEIPFTETI